MRPPKHPTMAALQAMDVLDKESGRMFTTDPKQVEELLTMGCEVVGTETSYKGVDGYYLMKTEDIERASIFPRGEVLDQTSDPQNEAISPS